MKAEEIIKGNKLIAEFIGLKQVKWPNEKELFWVNNNFIEDFTHYEDYSNTSKFDWGNSLPQTDRLSYDHSWNWLMSVVQKIEDLGFSISILNKSCCVLIKGKGIEDSITRGYIYSKESKIESVWLGVIEFIKWYNKQEKI